MDGLHPPDDRNAPEKLAARFFPNPDVPNVQVVYSTMCELIAQRRLPDGHRLPSIAQVAAAMEASTFTVLTAYKRLAADGVIATERRVATSVKSLARAQELLSRKMLAGAIAASRDLGVDASRLRELATVEVDRAYQPRRRGRHVGSPVHTR